MWSGQSSFLDPGMMTLHSWITQERKSIGKVLGFLGLTSEVTGFEIEPPILLIGICASVVIQLLKDTEIKFEFEEQAPKFRHSNSKRG